MQYSERKKRARKQLRTIQAYFNMSKKEREQAIIDEQRQKFIDRGGKVKQINPVGRDIDEIICIGDQLDAFELLGA